MTGDEQAARFTSTASGVRAINAALLILVLGAANCHGYIYMNYRFVPSQWVEVAGRTYRVADRPDERRMLVSQETNYKIKDKVWDEVVNAYFYKIRKECDITKVKPISLQHQEYYYVCN